MVVMLGEGWLNGLVQDTVPCDPRELVCELAAERHSLQLLAREQ